MTSETAIPPDQEAEPTATEQAEPSMEDILASIRKIIASDETPAVSAADDDVLELTEIASEDSLEFSAATPELAVIAATVDTTIVDPFDALMHEAASEPLIPMTENATAIVPEATALVAADTAALSAQSFAALTSELENQRITLPSQIELGDGKQTLEQLVTQIMRPLLKEWLDSNLSTTVERLVQKEIDRISKQHRD
jgi:uncharacterized protein